MSRKRKKRDRRREPVVLPSRPVRSLFELRSVSLALVSAAIAAAALANDVVFNWLRGNATDAPVHFDIALQPLTTGKVEYFDQVGEEGVRVQMLLHNNSVPDVELHNVDGRSWASTDFLIGTFKQNGVLYREHRSKERVEFDLLFPVFSKMSHSWLPSWIFRMPPPGLGADFGAQLVSAESDYRQYRWTLVNDGGRAVVRGGDTTPAGLNGQQ